GAFSGFWTQVTALCDVTVPGSYALRFRATGRSDSLGGLIDNVAIDPAPIPVPASLPLLAGAIGLCAMARGRRRGG
ncbi:MAG: hypothetical protein N2422_13475, partial [Rhodobacteraceae bacterium]|nr:hypothetical protein [Paracoccaceae bacterium]